MADRAEDINKLVESGIKSEKVRAELVEQLSGSSRRNRQTAAAALHLIAKADPKLVSSYTNDFVDALNRVEAQTRWESLETLALLVDCDSRNCDKAIPLADEALFDEDSGTVRLAAMRFLCKLGSTTATRSTKVWPLIDEAIQCYHGDAEFNDMLVAVVDFSAGKLDSEVKLQLGERMKFDAENAKGTLKRRATQIVENVAS